MPRNLTLTLLSFALLAFGCTSDEERAQQTFDSVAPLLETGRATEAIALLEQATELDPNLEAAWTQLAETNLAEERPAQALQAAQRAAALQPEGGPQQVLLGRAQMANEAHAQAVEAFERALSLDPGLAGTRPQLAEALDNLGRVQADADEWAEARRSFERSLELDPERDGVHPRLARALAQLGEVEPAAREYRVAIERGSERVRSQLSLAAMMLDDYSRTQQPAAGQELRSLLGALGEAPGELDAQGLAELNRLRSALAPGAGSLPVLAGLPGLPGLPRLAGQAASGVESEGEGEGDTRDALEIGDPALIREGLGLARELHRTVGLSGLPGEAAARGLGLGRGQLAGEEDPEGAAENTEIDDSEAAGQ